MTEQEEVPEKKRRDWLIILIILLFGFVCVILAGGWAIRFAPTWKMGTNMRSNIDPNSDFLTTRPDYYIEPLDPSILTQPAWINVFLTPGASFETSIPVTVPPTNIPTATNTIRPTAINSPTAIIPSATNTLPYYPLPTNTPKPPNTPVPPSSADLSITKTDGVLFYTPGSSLTYTIVVSNTSGPDAVIDATVKDTFPATLTNITWTCVPTGSASCKTNGTGDINETVNLSVGSFVTYTVNVDVLSSATGNLINTATVTPPPGVNDPNPGNNSAPDTNTPVFEADLWIEITDMSTDYTANAAKLLPNVHPYAYTITVHNAGPSDVTGATVSNFFSFGNASSIGWVCTPSSGGTCSAPAGAGDLNNQSVNLNSGAYVTFYLAAQVVNNPSGNLVNTATITAPGGVNDPPGNNSVSDIDTLVVASSFPYGDIGTGDIGTAPNGTTYNIPAGTYITLQFGAPLVVGSGNYLVYYELPQGANPGVMMDAVILQVGDGSNWYTVLNWGDGNADTNTNISLPLLSTNPTGTCAGEPDNCEIDASLLYNSTGITINLYGVVPNGSYPYIRIYSPGSPFDTDLQVEVDAIEILP